MFLRVNVTTEDGELLERITIWDGFMDNPIVFTKEVREVIEENFETED